MEKLKDLFALAGDLGYEGMRCLKTLHRIEHALLQNDGEILKMKESLLRELSHLTRTTERVSHLSKTLEERIMTERLTPIAPMFKSAASRIEALSKDFEKPVFIEINDRDIAVDEVILKKFSPIFNQILAPFIEYSIESTKERAARKKRPRAYIELSAKSVDSGHKIQLIGDGNGILPPYSIEAGQELATAGIRGHFEGKPGKWSAWTFYIPNNKGAIRMLPVRMKNAVYCIPSYCITRITDDVENAGSLLLEISIGIQRRVIRVDDVADPFDSYIKEIHPTLTAGGKYMGVVQNDPAIHLVQFEARNEMVKFSEELILVLDPADIVYSNRYGTFDGDKQEVAYAL